MAQAPAGAVGVAGLRYHHPRTLPVSAMPTAQLGVDRGYTIVRTIGKGSYGAALLVKDKEKRLRVMKTVEIGRLSEREQEDAVNEVKVFASLTHPYVVRHRESFIDSGTLAIVMDYAEGGDLHRHIQCAKQAYPETQVLRWLTQVALGLKYLHGRKVIHRDMKSQNLFLTKHVNLRIGDFGISQVIKNGSGQLIESRMLGTPACLSPEICTKALYSFAADIWALGCVLYEMATQQVPFNAATFKELVWKILHGAIPALPSPPYSPELRDMCAWILCRDMRRRPTSGDLVQQPMLQAEIKRMLQDGGYEAERPASPRGKEDLEQSATGVDIGNGSADASIAAVPGPPPSTAPGEKEVRKHLVPEPTPSPTQNKPIVRKRLGAEPLPAAPAQNEQAARKRLARPASAVALHQVTCEQPLPAAPAQSEQAARKRLARPASAVALRQVACEQVEREHTPSNSRSRPSTALQRRGGGAGAHADCSVRVATQHSAPGSKPPRRPRSAVQLSRPRAEPAGELCTTPTAKPLQRAPRATSAPAQQLSPVEMKHAVVAMATEVAGPAAAGARNVGDKALPARRAPAAAMSPAEAKVAAISAAAAAAAGIPTWCPGHKRGTGSTTKSAAVVVAAGPGRSSTQARAIRPHSAPHPQGRSSLKQGRAGAPSPSAPRSSSPSLVAAAPAAASRDADEGGNATPTSEPTNSKGAGALGGAKVLPSMVPDNPTGLRRHDAQQPVPPRASWAPHKEGPPAAAPVSTAQAPKRRLLVAPRCTAQPVPARRAQSPGALRPIRCRGGDNFARQLCSETPGVWVGRG